jgi:hypothetical protein
VPEPYVRPDVRRFLDYLNNLPGPRSHEVGPVEARRMMHASRQVADAPAGRSRHYPRSRGARSGREHPAPPVRCARGSRTRAGRPVPARRRFRARRPPHPRTVLHRAGPRAGPSRRRCRLSARSRASLAGGRGGCDRCGTLDRRQSRPARSQADRPRHMRRQRGRKPRHCCRTGTAGRAGGGPRARAMADLSRCRPDQGLSRRSRTLRKDICSAGTRCAGSTIATGPTRPTGAMHRC